MVHSRLCNFVRLGSVYGFLQGATTVPSSKLATGCMPKGVLTGHIADDLYR